MRRARGAGEEEGKREGKVSVLVALKVERRMRRRAGKLTIVSRHHDLNELDDLSGLELGVLEEGVKLGSSGDLMILLGVGKSAGGGRRGEEVEEEGVVVRLDVVVDGVDPVDLGGKEGRRGRGGERG